MALRQQVWVDRGVQGVLVGRILLYWLSAVLYVGIGSACFQYNQNPDWTLTKHAAVLFSQMWPWLPTVFLVLPLAIYDVVRLSNLFVGPIYRLRKHFAALRQDIACAPLTFREDDYWRDIAAPINDMQAEILRLRSGVIELQQVASQTSAIMANFKANLPDEESTGSASNELQLRGDARDNTAIESSLNTTSYEVKVEDHIDPEAKPTLSETNSVGNNDSAAGGDAESVEPKAEVAIAPIPIAPIPLAAEAIDPQTAASPAESV